MRRSDYAKKSSNKLSNGLEVVETREFNRLSIAFWYNIYGHGYLTYNQMASLMKKTEQYQALPAKVSQQVFRGLDKNWPSFFAASSEFKSHPDKFLGKPKIPGYKEPKKGINLLVYTIQAISKVGLRQGLVKLSP